MATLITVLSPRLGLTNLSQEPLDAKQHWSGLDATTCLHIALIVIVGEEEAVRLLRLHGVPEGIVNWDAPCRCLARMALANSCVFELCERLADCRIGSELHVYDQLSTAALLHTLDEYAELLRHEELASVLLILVARTTWRETAAFVGIRSLERAAAPRVAHLGREGSRRQA